MNWITFLVSLLILICVGRALVLEPLSINGEYKAVLLFAPGVAISPEQYRSFFQRLQARCDDYGVSLWIACPSFPGGTWISPRQFETSMEEALEKTLDLIGEGRRIHVFHGGHSRGGVAMQDLVKRLLSTPGSQFVLQQSASSQIADDSVLKRYKSEGLLLFASALQRKYRPDKLGSFVPDEHYPVATFGGDLDGLFRYTRLAEASYHAHSTFLVEGANHMAIATGNVPPFVKANDIPAEISTEEAQWKFAKYSASTIADILDIEYVHEQSEVLNIDWKLKLAARLLEQEGSHHLKPACNYLDEDDPRRSPGQCWTGSPWSSVAQNWMAGLDSPGISQINEDAMWQVWLINPVHLPEVSAIHQNGDLILNSTTVTQLTYPIGDDLDLGLSPIASTEMRVKMNSRQAMHVASGNSTASFEELDDNNQVCKQINERAFDLVLKMIPPETRKRYLDKGIPLEFGDDLGPFNAGPLWIWKDLKFERIKNGSGGISKVVVRSPTMRTPVDYPIKLSAGFHYCKLMSPARILEWISIDSLKLRKQ